MTRLLTIIVFLSQIVLVFGYLALANVRQTVVLFVLTEVKAHTLALRTYTHWDKTVYKPIAQITHTKGIDNDYGNSQQMIEEYYKAVPSARDKTLLYKYTRKHSTEDTACAVCGEHIQCIVYTAMTAPVNGGITYQRNDKSYEYTLTYSYISG